MVSAPQQPVGGRIDRFELGSVVGRGPFTTVYRAIDTVTRAPVALKVLPPGLSADTAEATRFRKALVQAAHLSHPHLQALRHLHEVWEFDDAAKAETGVSPGAQVLVTDLLEGEDIGSHRRSQAGGVLSWEAGTSILSKLSGALSTAHDVGLVHGVLSPKNIMVTASGPILLDLGVAYELRVSLSRLGEVDLATSLGPYASPEQRRGEAPGPEADQFALAALFVESLTGAFDDLSIGSVSVPFLSPEQNAVLAKALSVSPADRFPSCAAFMTALLSAPERPVHDRGPAPTSADAADKAVSVTEDDEQKPVSEEAPLREEVDLFPPKTPPKTPPADHRTGSEDEPEDALGPPSPERSRVVEVGDSFADGEAGRADEGADAEPGGDEQPDRSGRAGLDPRAPLPAVVGQASPDRAARLVNWAIGLSILALLALGAAGVYLRVLKEGDLAVETVPVSELETRDRLSRTFAYTAVFSGETQGSARLQFRLFGQASLWVVALEAGEASMIRERGIRDREVVDRGQLPRAPRADDRLTLVKEPESLGLFFNGVRVLSAPCVPQQWIEARWESTQHAAIPVSFSYQKIGPLVFADDFMHGEDEFGEWEPVSGDWSVHALQNPVRSANPFSFFGKGDDALALAGRWFWRNYSVRCAVHPLEGSTFGMKFCRLDDDHMYEVLWVQPEEGDAVLSLRRVVGGKADVLASRTVHVLPAFWVELSARQLDGVIVVSVDGQEQLRALDPAPLLGGRIGLWSKGGNGTVFDDVDVSPTASLALDMTVPDALPKALLSGLDDRPSFSSSGLLLDSSSPRHITVGGVLMKNNVLRARLSGLGSWQGELDLAVRQASGDRVVFRLKRDQSGCHARLLQERPDGAQELAGNVLEGLPDAAELSCHVLGSEVWGSVDGRIVCLSGDVTIGEQGQCAIRVDGEQGTLQLESLRVDPEFHLPPITDRVETFTHEESMQNWNSPVLEWTIQYGEAWPLYWHRSDFWQDVSMQMELPPLVSLGTSEFWGLAFGCPTDGSSGKAAVQASVTYDCNSHQLRLGVGSAEPATQAVELPPRQLFLSRRGGRLLVHADDDLIWNVPLPGGLGGLCRAGRIGRGATVSWAEAVSIRAAGVETYSFKRAPTSWIPAAGTWEVTNRWQCDPRWSFFSGVQRHGVACIWNKGLHGDNVTLEFFAGPKMDQDRGRRYEYAANLNAVICADGQDITSGYSFMFGGWDDRGSQIVKGKDILKENRQMTIPRHSSIHRRWFHVKIRKQGSRLTYWIDGARAAEAEDPGPLRGRRFGVWTWDNGMMVAQVRVSTTTALPSATLAKTVPKTPETPYD